MPDTHVNVRSRAMQVARAAAVTLVAAAMVAAPTAAVTTADAADQARPVIALDVDFYGVALSPDGDHSKDKARIGFTLAKRSEVIVKIRRTNRAGTLVYRERLGKVTRGAHTWTWNGRNFHGKVVRDGRYNAVFVADQVAENGKRRIRGTAVYVDTKFDVQWAPRLSADTVYPNTPGREPDFIGLTLGSEPSDPMTALGKVVSTLKDALGQVVWTREPFEYHAWEYSESMPLGFLGRDVTNKYPLPAGTYRLRYKVWDMAGNPGGSKAVTVYVSDKPLVEATGSVVVPPTGSRKSSELVDGTPPASMTSATVGEGRASPAGGDDPQPIPCGTVVPSEVYVDPGAMSFRSADTCEDSWFRPSVATATGKLELDTLTAQVAPRGLRTAWLSMRGRPTVPGETDTAKLCLSCWSYPYYDGNNIATSTPVAEETVTTTQPNSYPFEAPWFTDYVRAVYWSIATVGADSYDVAAVTVHYTYLTPQH